MTYTDESKSGSVLPYKSLSEVTFLKRSFARQVDGTFKAPMVLENVLEITNWIKGKSANAATEENCSQAIMELTMHDKDTYTYWSRRIQDECRRVGITLLVPTYFEQQEMYLFNRDNYAREEYVPLW